VTPFGEYSGEVLGGIGQVMIRPKRLMGLITLLILVAVTLFFITLVRTPPLLPLGRSLPNVRVADGRSLLNLYLTDVPHLVFVGEGRCPHCNYELDVINRSRRDLGRFQLIVLALDDSLFVGRLVRWPTLSSQPDNVWVRVTPEEVQRALGVTVVPSIFLVDRFGVLRARFVGETQIIMVDSALRETRTRTCVAQERPCTNSR
jgi:hypothetical protein